jgi:flagellar assembly protein FliH
MSATPLSSSDISLLIDYLLKSKDPATVGLRKILKLRKEKENAFPLRPATFEEFYVEGKNTDSCNKDELIIIELEKQINDLKRARERDRNDMSAKLERVYEKGHTDGFSKGEAAAYEKARNEYNASLDELQKKTHEMCVALEASKKAVYSGASEILLALSFEFVKKILHAEVTGNREILLSVLQKALSYIADKDRLIIKVAKDDMETVSGRKDYWMPVGEHLESIIIEEDERIEKGGCIVESNSGIIDARLGVQFEELKEVVQKAWESANPYNQTSSPVQGNIQSATAAKGRSLEDRP